MSARGISLSHVWAIPAGRRGFYAKGDLAFDGVLRVEQVMDYFARGENHR